MPCKVAFSRRLDHHRVVLLQGGFLKPGNWSHALHGQHIANIRELMSLYWESKVLLKPQCQKRSLGTFLFAVSVSCTRRVRPMRIKTNINEDIIVLI